MVDVSMSQGGSPARASSIMCLIYLHDSNAGPTAMTDGFSSATTRNSVSQVESG